MNAKFLVLEGMDGTGKTTQATRLVAKLETAGRRPLHLREPGTTDLGERLRDILLDSTRTQISPRTEALMFFASRAEMLDSEVAPALAAGRDVVCERFTPSTVAYQGLDQELTQFVFALDSLVVESALSPALVIILDLSAEESLARATDRSTADNFEARGIEFQQQVRAGYRAYAEQRPAHTRVIEVAGLDPDQVEAAINLVIDPLLAHV